MDKTRGPIFSSSGGQAFGTICKLLWPQSGACVSLPLLVSMPFLLQGSEDSRWGKLSAPSVTSPQALSSGCNSSPCQQVGAQDRKGRWPGFPSPPSSQERVCASWIPYPGLASGPGFPSLLVTASQQRHLTSVENCRCPKML